MNPKLALLVLAFRISISLLTRTFFQPDEYFQCLEPAHRLAFGYGHLTWEWVADKPIRSLAYPALWAAVYKILAWSRLDGTSLLILGPKFLAGLMGGAADIFTYKLAQANFGQNCANVTLFLSLTSFFHSLALTRTLATSLETILTIWALSYWPFKGSSFSRRKVVASLCIAAFSCILRPTGAILWIWLMSRLLVLGIDTIWLLSTSVVIGVAALITAGLFDTLSFSGTNTGLSLLNFLSVNSSKVSEFYGTMPWHYYLTQGLPLICGVSITHFALGFKDAFQSNHEPAEQISYLIVWVTTVYSAIPHKEWRFLHPLLPLILVLSSNAIIKRGPRWSGHTSPPTMHWISKPLLVATFVSACFSFYAMRYHSYGQIAVMDYLRHIPSTELKSVGFLMPCHSTPFQSHLHRLELDSGKLWALGCEPPLNVSKDEPYLDQTDIFYASPTSYLSLHFPANVDPNFPPSPMPITPPGQTLPKGVKWKHEWPSQLVFFGALLNDDGVEGLLVKMGYNQVWSAGSLFEEDARRRGGVHVWKWGR